MDAKAPFFFVWTPFRLHISSALSPFGGDHALAPAPRWKTVLWYLVEKTIEYKAGGDRPCLLLVRSQWPWLLSFDLRRRLEFSIVMWS
jgi:hypothetical protein